MGIPNTSYIFNSDRLGFRNYVESDVVKMIEISSNPKVMEFFPSVATAEQTVAFVRRMQLSFDEKGYCYFAVDRLTDGKFIGFIGLLDQTYAAPFTPCVDIGWRLHPNFWEKGYATEGATRCLAYAFQDIGLSTVVSVCTATNVRSEHVMKKIGMIKQGMFLHPSLVEHPQMQSCVWYQAERILAG